MWKSFVATTWSQRWAAPASDPPSQKSFWTSTMMSARMVGTLRRGDDGHRDRRVARGELEALPRDGDERVVQSLPALLHRGRGGGGLAAHEAVLLEQAVAGLPVRYPLGADDFLG